MSEDQKRFSRRQFLKSAGVAGAGSLLAGYAVGAPAAEQPATLPAAAPKAGEIKVPTRAFGKSGRQVSVLGLGGMFDIDANQLMLKQAINWGVTYWDTADCYHAGSEAGIGRFFGKYPQEREKIFLVTKSCERQPEGIGKLLARSLERMQTNYIDLYFLHGVKTLDDLNDDVRKWAEKAKAEKKIRLFGFSTHSNMAELLMGAAKLDWIDGIMLTYNYRNMHSPEMTAAVEACVQAGIGLTAMKTQAKGSWYDWSKGDSAKEALANQFRQKGWSEEQAKLKAVWQNPRIACVCSHMRLLKSNADAAVDPTALSSGEMRLFQEYACGTAANYCTGCGRICEATLSTRLPVSDIMRYHMYSRGYGRSEWAKEHFGNLPASVRRELARADFSAAEARCPQHMPIGRLMREALEDFV
ncbi:MAG: aldo/keto reductase [Desulfobacterales bacterium]|nr:aldo/keto reductase [Desulfobacterales bacterium]